MAIYGCKNKDLLRFLAACGIGAHPLLSVFVALVDGAVVFRLVDTHFVAVFHVVADPAGDILRRGVHVQYFVDILMVKRIFYHLFDVGKVGDHTVLVQFACLAINHDNPVVPVQCLAFALVTEVEIVCSGNLQTLFYIIHCSNYELGILIFRGILYPRLAEGFDTLGAGAAFAAVFLPPFVATPCLGIVDTECLSVAGDVGFGEVGIGGE